MRFKSYMTENIKFANAKDQDYPNPKSGVIIFNPKDTYILKGKAHNLSSHAIKHLKDINPNFYYKIIDKVMTYIKNLDNYQFLSNKGKFTRGTIINTLDLVNDKIHFQEKLTKEEKELKKYIEKLAIEYKKKINEFLRSSINIDKIPEFTDIWKYNKPIQFEVLEAGTNSPSTHYLNFTNLLFAVRRKGTMRSLYPLDDKNEILRKYKKNKILSDKLITMIYQ